MNWEHKRVKHAVERMWLRGTSIEEVEEALRKGQRVPQPETGLTETFHRHFSVVYEERVWKHSGVRKVFPITVKLW